jgi:hypothetical protein
VSLVHPAVQSFAQQNTWFSVTLHSVFDPLPEPADAIRSMNIFNVGYFPEDRLRAGVLAVFESLRVGGLWIVGRSESDEGANLNATIFEKDRGRFVPVSRIGHGSEIEKLAGDLGR